ncbi:MAG: NRAMP family divalent metal transporter [Rhodospirillales bacterium]|nr:NRAMP family divalent metal transporter [Rhodospirillales bacterium]
MRGGLIAAIFLMATSAIGPGFITQTATFTAQLGAAFAFAILASVLIDFVVQMNIWRITALTGRRASETANAALPGAGYLLSVLVLFGGLVFNIGNIAGAGLGLNAVFGLDPKIGGAISALIAIAIFLSRRAGLLLDRTIVWLGLVMIGLTLLVAVLSNPPVGEALRQTVLPAVVDFPAIVTIVGGTVGGYITYAGAHRLLDKGLTGEANLASITRGALSGIAVTGLMRFILFLAILGVTASGVSIDVASRTANPAAQAFQAAAGDWGLRIFGVIFWAAAITSVIGAAYTSVSFLTVFRAMDDRGRNVATVVFIGISLAIFLVLGSPPALLLVFAGGFNGLILPIGLTIFTWIGFARSDLMGGHHYSRPLLALSAIVCLLTWYIGISSVGTIFAMLG